MKIMIVDLGSRLNTFGGQARMAAMLYRDLAKRGFDTYYLGYKTEYIGKGRNTIMLERGKRLGLSLRRSRLSEVGALRFGYNLFIVRGLRNLGMSKEALADKISEVRPDVVIANSLQDVTLLRYLRRRGLRFKSVYIDHGSLSTGTTSGYFSKEGVPLTVGTGFVAGSVESAKKQFIGFFDMNIAINRAQLSSMRKMTRNVAYIPNGMPKPAARDKRKEAEIRRRYGIGADDFVVFYIGRMFERQKNVSTLIRAFRGMKEKDAKLLLVGEGPSAVDYAALAEGDGRVIMTGSVKDEMVNGLYGVASVFVLPSNWEGFSLTLLEAASHSVPLILSKNAYIDDLKVKGVGEIVSFDTKDADALRGRIELLYRSRSARAKAVQVSRNITRTFSEERMVSDYAKMLKGLEGKR